MQTSRPERHALKLDDCRAQALELLADHVLLQGLSASSLRTLAKAAKMSDRMLLDYFKDKAEIIAATLAVISHRLATVLGDVPATPMPLDALRSKLAPLLLAEKLWRYGLICGFGSKLPAWRHVAMPLLCTLANKSVAGFELGVKYSSITQTHSNAPLTRPSCLWQLMVW